MYHFVYLSFEDSKGGRNYIGKRSCLNPYDNYLGSFSDTSFNPTNKIILSYYKTAEEAIKGEIQWQRVFRVKDDSNFANQVYQTDVKFDCTGRKHSEKTKLKMSISQRECQNRHDVKIKKSENIRKALKNEEIKLNHSSQMKRIGKQKESQLKKSISLKKLNGAVHSRNEWKVRQSISQVKSQNDPVTKELKSRRIKEAMQSEQVKDKLRSRKNPQKGKIWVNDGCNSLMVFPNEVPEGYKRGRSKK